VKIVCENRGKGGERKREAEAEMAGEQTDRNSAKGTENRRAVLKRARLSYTCPLLPFLPRCFIQKVRSLSVKVAFGTDTG